LPDDYKIMTISFIQQQVPEANQTFLEELTGRTEQTVPISKLPKLVNVTLDIVNKLPEFISETENTNVVPEIFAIQTGLQFISQYILPKLIKVNNTPQSLFEYNNSVSTLPRVITQ
jgi:hypothetical protein